jgi:hypothetical protein
MMPTLRLDQVDGLLRTGASCRVDAHVAPRFRVGDIIVVRNINPVGHTRLPRYVRGKHGTVERDRGVFVFPDTNAHGEGHKPQHVYGVRFTARELWGSQASDRDSLYIDLWDDYMDRYPG